MIFSEIISTEDQYEVAEARADLNIRFWWFVYDLWDGWLNIVLDEMPPGWEGS